MFAALPLDVLAVMMVYCGFIDGVRLLRCSRHLRLLLPQFQRLRFPAPYLHPLPWSTVTSWVLPNPWDDMATNPTVQIGNLFARCRRFSFQHFEELALRRSAPDTLPTRPALVDDMSQEADHLLHMLAICNRSESPIPVLVDISDPAIDFRTVTAVLWQCMELLCGALRVGPNIWLCWLPEAPYVEELDTDALRDWLVMFYDVSNLAQAPFLPNEEARWPPMYCREVGRWVD